MNAFLKNMYVGALLLPISLSSYCSASSNIDAPCYRYAMVRDISDSFEDSLKLHPPESPIDLNLAKKQHEEYIIVLKNLVSEVIRLEADASHPDSNFIEDTAVIVEDIAVISRMGALERRGEEAAIVDALENMKTKHIVHLKSPATMDGGDVLYTGKHLFVGLSHRTNQHAVNQLKEIFKDKVEVVGIPVTEGLHLKSAISFFDFKTLIVAESAAGLKIQAEIEKAAQDVYTFVSVPDSVASNVLRVGSTLLIQKGFPRSEAILEELCNKNSVPLIKMDMSELIKADGALTCGSLLFN